MVASEKMRNKIVVAYFKVLCQHLPSEIGENYEARHRTAGVRTEDGAPEVANAKGMTAMQRSGSHGNSVFMSLQIPLK
jgi:hypothetical protein